MQAGQRLCTSATIEEPFILPDGSEHEAGDLKICHLQKHYPTSSLLVSYVDGKNVGLLLGVAGHNEAGATGTDGCGFTVTALVKQTAWPPSRCIGPTV